MAATEDLTPAKVKSQWYQALFEEDCIAVMELLDIYPSLLKVGWDSKPSQQVAGRKRREATGWTQSSWKGRTALHVGASRGCVTLIMQVLRLCNLRCFSIVNEAYERWSFLDQTPTGEQEVAASEGSSSSDFPHDDAIQENDPQQGDERAQAAVTSGSASKGPLRKLQKTLLTNVFCSMANGKRKGKAQQLSARVGRQHVRKKYGNPNTISRNDVSTTDRRHLLLAKDGESGLDALAIAVLHGKKEIIDLLRYCAGELEDHTHYDKISIDARSASSMFDATGNLEKRKLLRQVMVEAVTAFIDPEDVNRSVDSEDAVFRPPPSTTMHRRALDEYLELRNASTTFLLDKVGGHSVFTDYFKHRDFSFLPPEEYLFHFLCSKKSESTVVESGMIDTLWAAVGSRQGDQGLGRFLLTLTDGQGRAPFHIAMEYSNETNIIGLLTGNTTDTEAIIVALTAKDGAGRSPLQRAAILGHYDSLSIILNFAANYHEVASTCRDTHKFQLEDWGSSRQLNFPLKFPLPQTPLHAALFNKNFSCAELLLKWGRELKLVEKNYLSSDAVLYRQGNSVPLVSHVSVIKDVKEWIEWDLLELACLVGAPVTFIEKIKGDLATPRHYNRNETTIAEGTSTALEHQWHPLHLAASSGSYDLVKFLIDDPQCGPYLEDFEGNSALHHAMKVREFELGTHLLYYVNAEHYSLSMHNRVPWMAKEEILDANRIAERQGCINLLLQAGCNAFKTNKRKQVPYPTGSLHNDRFLSWWYQKQEKEFTAAQNNLKYLANAITLTATLVGTTSYAGPSLDYDANHMQFANGWVSTFIVCDNLSFYFAIAAIVLSLIPFLPMPQQAMLQELQRTREMVILAVGILLPSIFFIFVAFICSSILKTSADITLEVGLKLTVGSTLIGTALCLFVFSLFSIKFLAFIFPKHTSIRYAYNLAFFPKRISKVFSREGNDSR